MDLYIRENYLQKIRGFYHDTDIIKVITGVRRCGKSCLMETIRQELVDNGISNENILFFNLDSRKYRKTTTPDQLDELIDSFPASNGVKYLFIDEIQNVEGFEEVINSFRDDGGYSIFITGSNSYLLSGELVTKLTGRYIEFELFPLSFGEYIGMKKFYGKPVDNNLLPELDKYLLEGGFPRAVQFDTLKDKRTYVISVINEIFEKDIKKRLKIRNVEAFNNVRNFIINNFGSTTSIRNLKNELEKNGIMIERKTLNRYIDALLKSKVLYCCDRFDMKSKKSLAGEKNTTLRIRRFISH